MAEADRIPVNQIHQRPVDFRTTGAISFNGKPVASAFGGYHRLRLAVKQLNRQTVKTSAT